MAETPVQTNVNVSDVPDWQRPYYAMLMNGAAGLTFDPNFIREQMANFRGTPGSFNPVTGLRPYTPPQFNGGQTPDVNGGPNTPNGARDNGFNITPEMISALQASLLSPQGQAAADGGVERLFNSKLGGVNLVNAGTPIGGGGVTTPSSGGVNTNPVTIGPGTGGTTYQPYTGQIGGSPSTPTGAAVPTTPGSVPSSSRPTLTPTQIAANNAAAGIVAGLAGQSGPMGSTSGYNPSHYASDSLASMLAGSLGARNSHTVNEGPNAPPPQNLLDFGIGGSGNMLNAGLVHSMLTDPGQAPFAAARLRAELAYLNNPANRSYAKGGMIRYNVGGNVPTTTANPSYPYRQYTPYGGQRILDWTGQQGLRQVSPFTLQAEQGMGSGIASYFDQNGQINAGRDQNGQATTNFGIANDQLDWAGRQIGNAMEGFQGWNQFAQGMQHGYSPTNFNTSDIANPSLMSAGQISVDPLTQYQMQGPDSVSASSVNIDGAAIPRFRGIAGQGPDSIPMWTDPGVSTTYMNPYQDQVTRVQRQRAMDDFAESRGARDSQAVAAGAFGGARAAVQDGVARRALDRQLQAIDAQGLNNAYLNGQQQFNADRETGLSQNLQGLQFQGNLGQFNANQNMQAQLANQAARLTAGQTNLDAALQTQALGTNAGLAAQQSNQGANVTQFGQLLNAQQNAEQMRNQFGLQAQQMGDQSRLNFGRLNLDQFGLQGQMGMAALNGLTNSANALGGIASTRADLPRLAQQLELQRLQAMQGAGASQDARQQGMLNIGYQDFQNQQNWPFQLANFYMGQMQGVPVGVNQEQMQYQNTSPASQWGGLAAAGIGALGNYYQNRPR